MAASESARSNAEPGATPAPKGPAQDPLTQDSSAGEASNDQKPGRAKRVYGWTCNLLATAIVLWAGLTFGRQVLQWWRNDPAPAGFQQEAAAVLGEDALGTPGQPLDLRWGDFTGSLRHVEFTGDRSAARAELRRLCESALPRAGFPTSPPGPAESRLLASLAQRPPNAETPDGWLIYEQAGPIPLVAAVGEPSLEKVADAAVPSEDNESETTGEVAPASRRVVSWGLGIHLAGTRWTLLLLTAQSASPIGEPRRAPQIPPGARRSLSLEAVDGEQVVAFVGHGPGKSWRQFYDQQFSTGAPPRVWRQLGQTWQQRYELSTVLVDVVLSPGERVGELQGLLTIRERPKASSTVENP